MEMAFTLENFLQQALTGEGLLDTCWLRLHCLMLLVKQQRYISITFPVLRGARAKRKCVVTGAELLNTSCWSVSF